MMIGRYLNRKEGTQREPNITSSSEMFRVLRATLIIPKKKRNNLPSRANARKLAKVQKARRRNWRRQNLTLCL